jgi:hypothetical protein
LTVNPATYGTHGIPRVRKQQGGHGTPSRDLSRPRHLAVIDLSPAPATAIRWQVWLPVPGAGDLRAWCDVTQAEAVELVRLGDWVRALLPDGREFVGGDELTAEGLIPPATDESEAAK